MSGEPDFDPSTGPAAPELHPVTGEPWSCACPSVRAHDCYRARYPPPLDLDDAPSPGDYDYDYEDCRCACHDWEGEDDD